MAIAPGIIVRPSDYEARFAALDLASLRTSLTPEVFKAFVRHVGVLQGIDQVDVEDLLEDESD